MRSLSWKLGGALLLMVVVSVGIMAYVINLSTTREFRQYVLHGNMMYGRSVESSLVQLYSQQNGWSGLQQVLGSLLISNDDRLVVADGSGTIVGDTAGDWLGKNAGKLGLEGGIPLVVSGQQVGEYYVLSYGGMMGMMGRMGGAGAASSMPMPDAAEQDFLSGVNRSLWLAGLIAAAVALLVGLFLTRQITRPIHALKRGATQLADGVLGYRVQVNSKDELGALAQSFNAMADSLDRSEQARRRLAADIAHELRTPLTVIEGTVDGILDNVFEPDREHLESIKEQTALLTRLIGDLRDLSLAESGQLRLELSPTDMVDLVRRKLSQTELKAREKNVRMRLDAGGEIPDVSIDPARMEQVIANLLANAVRHTPPGGAVTVSVKKVSADDARQVERPGIIISVADTGEGIAPEHLTDIFERFYRVEHSRSRSEGGVGLGLAIVKQMVEAHGGRVWAESEPGRGSTFYVTLPLTAVRRR